MLLQHGNTAGRAFIPVNSLWPQSKAGNNSATRTDLLIMRVSLFGKTALVASFVFVSVATAQTLSYSLLPAGTTVPSPRFDGTIAYDPSRKANLPFRRSGQLTTK